MKTIIMLLGLIGAATAQAQVKDFVCSDEINFKSFHAVLDSSHFDPGSGYADMRRASFNDGYISANLLCESRPEDGGPLHFSCVGYLFNMADTRNIVEVKVDIEPKKNSASVEWSPVIQVGLVRTSNQWTCALSK